jgi:manganese/zinc/iron transport system ATP- binding protein
MMALPYRRETCHWLSMPDAPAVDVRDLTVRMNSGERPALSGITMAVPVGTRAALVGPNGAGKSTLLKTLVGLIKPQVGTVLTYGMPGGGCRHRVAYLPQRGEIDWRFPITVRELIGAGRYVHRGWMRRLTAADRDLVQAEIDRLNLHDLADRQIGQLSGGQQQRTILARALVQGADLLLLDEPMTAVDAETREVLHRVLAELQAGGKTAIIATHDLDRLERDFDQIVYLVDGEQVESVHVPANGFDRR